MTISLPGSSKKGLSGLIGRKNKSSAGLPKSKKQLDGAQVARLFNKEVRNAKPIKPAKLSDREKNAQTQLTSLRGALYADD